MREVERQVMLRIIDQRWREHLEEMDYLKEGINLRAMGQKDPLTEWQREGFEMFGSMMKGIAQDFVRYVMHVQVVQEQAPAPAAQPLVTEESGPAEPGSEPSGIETTPAPAATPAARRPGGDASGSPDCTGGAEHAHVVLRRRRRLRLPAGGRQRRRRAGGDPALIGAVDDRAAGRHGPAGTGRPSRRPSSRTSGPRRRATRHARAGRARSSRCATAPAERRPCMRDFTDDLRELRRRLGEAEVYLRVGESRNRLTELEAEMGRPDLWDDADAAKALTAEYANVRDDLATYDSLASQLDDAEVLHELAREEDDASQEGELAESVTDIVSAASISSTCAACSRASTTRPTRSSRSTPRTAASTPRTGRRCCCGCTSAGPSAAASRSASTACPRAPRPASCRPSSPSPAATRTAS